MAETALKFERTGLVEELAMDTDAAVKLSVVILCGGKKITWKDDIRWLYCNVKYNLSSQPNIRPN